MKKVLVFLLVALLAVSTLAGCGGAKSVKTGLAVIQSTARSTSATADAAGLGEAYNTAVAVMVDEDGKVVKCFIDMIQVRINFDTTGTITTAMDATFDSKKVLGDAYGMIVASGIGKEWYEQAAAMEDYVVGKTAEEIAAIAVTEEGVAADADLAAGVTVHITDLLTAIVKAINNAEDMGATEEDMLGMALYGEISHSSNAAADADGVAQGYVTYAVTTTDADGMITSCIIDASQTNVTFDMTGTITSDVNSTDYKTKNELGPDYGMIVRSEIGKEWDEQAASFAEYVTGKTAAEVDAIAVSEEGDATDADLLASVTIGIDIFIDVVSNSVAMAK